MHFLPLFCTTKTWNCHVTHYFYWGIVVCAHQKFCWCLCSCSLLFFYCCICWLSYFTLASCGADRRAAVGRTHGHLTTKQLTKWCSMVLRYACTAMKCIIMKREECIRSGGTLIYHILGRQPQNVTSYHLFLFFKKWFELSSWRAATNWEMSPVL